MARRLGRNIDWMTFSLYLAMVGIGWLMIYTVGYSEDYSKGFSHFMFETQVGKQTIWIGIAFAVFLFTYIIDRKFWETFAYPIYGVGLVLLVAVLIFGREIKGATSWFAFGSFTFQPSEFAKFGTALAMAAYLSTYRVNLRQLRHQVLALGLILVPTGLILLQPDAGSALVFLSFLMLMYREGFPANVYILGFTSIVLLLLGFVYPPGQLLFGLGLLGLLALLFGLRKGRLYWLLGWGGLAAGVILFFKPAHLLYFAGGLGGLLLIFSVVNWVKKNTQLATLVLPVVLYGAMLVYVSDFTFHNFLKPHQQDRINVWLNPAKCDRQGSLYNVLQSKMAIGSGGLQGKGFLEGTLTKGNFVPEQSTDFIFCTIGEEQGFVGTFAIIGLFLLLLLRIVTIAERQRSAFAKCYAYGVLGILFVHIVVNIGMTMGLMPIIGIPLPLISKGGSSLLGFTVMIAVLLKLDGSRHRNSV